MLQARPIGTQPSATETAAVNAVLSLLEKELHQQQPLPQPPAAAVTAVAAPPSLSTGQPQWQLRPKEHAKPRTKRYSKRKGLECLCCHNAVFARMLCKTHYESERRDTLKRRKTVDPCGIGGCDRKIFRRQMCVSHYRKFR